MNIRVPYSSRVVVRSTFGGRKCSDFRWRSRFLIITIFVSLLNVPISLLYLGYKLNKKSENRDLLFPKDPSNLKHKLRSVMACEISCPAFRFKSLVIWRIMTSYNSPILFDIITKSLTYHSKVVESSLNGVLSSTAYHNFHRLSDFPDRWKRPQIQHRMNDLTSSKLKFQVLENLKTLMA